VSLCERLFAAVYDPLSARSERKFGADLKRQLLANAHGRVLEIGVGTGLSFLHYPPDVELAGVEPSPHMLKRARRRAAELGRKVELVEAPAEQLPFADDSFDTVVSLTVLCTVRDAQRTLGEIRRVLRPGGRFVFLEHVRSAMRSSLAARTAGSGHGVGSPAAVTRTGALSNDRGRGLRADRARPGSADGRAAPGAAHIKGWRSPLSNEDYSAASSSSRSSAGCSGGTVTFSA
jgi:SAM-dependent methyltransferase